MQPRSLQIRTHLQQTQQSGPRSKQLPETRVHSNTKAEGIVYIVSEDHQISEEFFNILGWPEFQGLPGLACAINSNLIKICRLERFQLKAWVFRYGVPFVQKRNFLSTWKINAFM